MERPASLLRGRCSRWQCNVFALPERADRLAGCIFCGNFTSVENFTRFGDEEWVGSSDPHLLNTCLVTLGLRLSDRRLRLIACAMARAVLDWRDDFGYRLTVETGEALADGQPPAVPVELVRQPLVPDRIIGRYPPEFLVALRCLDEPEEWSFFGEDVGVPSQVILDVFCDTVPNPFVPLEWRPVWLTSTVCNLAAHVYAERAFDLMPILGDALMDAGCDHQLVQDHCRTDKPHARGCWVVDAILGKS